MTKFQVFSIYVILALIVIYYRLGKVTEKLDKIESQLNDIDNKLDI